jgi:hypothetical protein
VQADLRGRFDAKFDAWWESAKLSLPTMRVPFSVIVELRNQALKRGELLPRMVVGVRVDHPTIEEVSFTLDVQEGRIAIAQESYTFRPGQGPSLQLADPSDSSQFDQEFERIIPELREVFRSLNETEPAFETSTIAYLLESGGSAVSFGELIDVFSEHVAAMERLINEADTLFQDVSR